jgi:Tfp pilus assembly protein PilX
MKMSRSIATSMPRRPYASPGICAPGRGRRDACGTGHRPARRGFALYLVLVTLAVCVLVGTTFLAASGTAAVTGQQNADRLRARMIAEAGLNAAIRYVQTSSTWRTAQTNGQWISNQAFEGGTLSLWGQDGSGVDANGNITGGDGSLSNNSTDPVVLTSLGVYGQARYRVRAVVAQASGSTIAAEEKIEIKRNGLIDSYNHTAGAYGGSNTGAAARISANATGKPNVTFKRSGKITGTLYLPVGGDSAKAVDLSRGGMITGGVSNLAVEENDIEDVALPDYTPVATDRTYNGSTVTTLSSDLICNKLTIKDSAVLKIVGTVNIICDGDFLMDNTARIVLDNPIYGNSTPYSQTGNTVASKQIATPITVPETISVRYIGAYVNKNGRSIRLAIYTDNGSDMPGELIVQSAVETMTSDSFYWHEAAVTPTTLAPGKYWVALCFNDNAANYRYKNGGGRTEIRNNNAVSSGFLGAWGTSDASTNNAENLYITGNVAGQGGTLHIYTNANCTIQSSAVLNPTTGDATRLVLHHNDSEANAAVTMKNNAVFTGTVHAPVAKLDMADAAKVYGLVRVADLKMKGTSRIYGDTSGGTAAPGVLVDETIDMDDSAEIAGLTGDAIVAVNTVGTPVIWLRDASIVRGNTFGGPGGIGGNTDVKVGRGATLTGTSSNLTSAVDLSIPAAPSGLPSVGARSYSSGTTTISSSFRCTTLTITNSAIVNISGDITIVATGKVTIQKTSQLKLNSGARLTIYFSEQPAFIESAQINLNGDPGLLRIYYSGTRGMEIKNSVKLCATLKSPGAEVKIKDTTHFYGSLFARKLVVDQSGQIHFSDAGSSRLTWIEGR